MMPSLKSSTLKFFALSAGGRSFCYLGQIRWFASSQVDHFARLNIPRSFAISSEELKQSYHKLMNELHPDRQLQKSAQEQQLAAKNAAQVTLAYNVLSQPHERAVHMLDLLDMPLDETSSSDLVGVEFLMEMMELREEIAMATHQDVYTEMLMKNQGRMEDIYQKLIAAFDGTDLQEALKLTAELQFFNRIDQTLREKLEVK